MEVCNASPQVGPVTESELSRLFADGTIHARTYIWSKGLSEWTELAVALPGCAHSLTHFSFVCAHLTGGVAMLSPVKECGASCLSAKI